MLYAFFWVIPRRLNSDAGELPRRKRTAIFPEQLGEEEEALGGTVVYDVINNLFCLCFIGPEALCIPLRGGVRNNQHFCEQNNRGKYLEMR
jgi:hypothetical protein